MGGAQRNFGLPAHAVYTAVMQREMELRQYLPAGVTMRTSDHFHSPTGVWKVKLAIWTAGGEVIEFEENRDVFPSKAMIAQAMLVA